MPLGSMAALCLVMLASPLVAKDKSVETKDVPGAVQTTIDAQSRGWSTHEIRLETDDGETSYEVELVQGDKRKDLRIDTAGSLLEMEEDLSVGDLPQEVAAAAKERFASAPISHVEKVVEAAAAPHYELTFGDGEDARQATLDATGKLVSEEKEKSSHHSKSDNKDDDDDEDEDEDDSHDSKSSRSSEWEW